MTQLTRAREFLKLAERAAMNYDPEAQVRHLPAIPAESVFVFSDGSRFTVLMGRTDAPKLIVKEI